MANDAPNVSLTALNDANQKPIVFVSQPAVLDISLVNNGDPIGLSAVGSASYLEIFLPSFFTFDEVKVMNISFAGWTFSVNSQDQSLVLTYAGSSPATWAQGEALDFKITNVQSDAQPTADAIQINFQNMSGNVPIQVQTPLTLSNPPKPGNASLGAVLQVSLDSQGSIYVSTETDPLQNTLFLNLKNIGSSPLYSGKTMWTGTPKVTVTFVYGLTSGALAPDNDKSQPALGSAWNISGAVAIDQTDGWAIQDPSTTGDAPHPKWILTPVNTNQQIIGVGADANVTFSFSEIISLTAPGHTQMVVQFSGFMKDENTFYDDEVFVIDIIKQNPPATRGLLNFFSDSPTVTVTRPDESISIGLRWAMFDVAKISLICSFPGIALVNKTYPNPQPLDYDHSTLTIPGTSESVPIFITIQAFDGNGGYLNSMQFTVFVNAMLFVDRSGRAYPVVLLNNQLWMAANLDQDDGGDSFFYNNMQTNEQKFGRLYTTKAVSSQTPPDGWRIPSKQDWQNLFDSFGSAAQAYAALIDGGTSGFNARLGGNRDVSGVFTGLLIFAFYRTSSGQVVAGFSSKSNTVNLAGTLPDTAAMSIRYVHDL
jgi:uncharacterized protein (TIGR02145 family)